MARTLVTGATGLLGSHWVAQLLHNDPAAEVWMLVRGESMDAVVARRNKILSFHFSGAALTLARERVHAVRGDVRRDDLGLSPHLRRELTESLDYIVHSAANTSWTAPEREMTDINELGTKRVLTLAREAARYNLKRLVHISTAFVAGNRCGLIREDELECGQSFHTSYERSKFEAERAVRASGVPFTVLRPGGVVGDSTTGRTLAFNVLYFPLKLLWHRLLPFLPGPASRQIEVLPVDHIARASHYLGLHPATDGSTFHLTTGQRSYCIKEFAALAVRYFNKHRSTLDQLREVRLLPGAVYRRLYRPFMTHFADECLRDVFEMLTPYEAYVRYPRHFDTTRVDTLSEAAGLSVPSVHNFLEPVIDYCIRSNWGRVPDNGPFTTRFAWEPYAIRGMSSFRAPVPGEDGRFAGYL